MTNKHLSLAAVIATAILSTTIVLAQTTPEQSTAKPSPYQGVSTPPADDVITTSADEPAQPPAARVAAPAPVAPAAPVAAAAPYTPAPNVAENPDAGIVETPLPPPSQGSPAAVQLSTRAVDSDTSNASVNDPDAQIVTDVSGPANALPEGTAFRVRMLQEVDAETATPGTPFRGQLTQDLVYDGRVVVPVGSELRGKIVYATSGRRISGRSIIHLRPDAFILPDGTKYELHAQAIDTQGSDTKAAGEGNIVPKEHVKRTLVELAIGSGTGAVVGARVGAGVGAAVGAGVGAGVVTAHWLLEDHSAEITAQSTVVFSLTDPMFLTPVRD